MMLLLLCARCSRHHSTRIVSVICSDCREQMRRKKSRARTVADAMLMARDAALRGVVARS